MGKIIDICVGCQYGSEAKGLVASWLATREDYDWLISVNSAQAGHTAPYLKDGEIMYVVTRQLPSACVTNHTANIFIGPGAVINTEVLVDEIAKLEQLGIPIVNRLYISGSATSISVKDLLIESDRDLVKKIGSTGEGVGAALSRRAIRTAATIEHRWAQISDGLNMYGIPMAPMVVGNRFSSDFVSGKIFLEGSQGYGLSTFSGDYPYVTSRDTTVSAFLSYAQLPPRNIRDIYGVYRTYPIRVGGNSGPMYEEIDWDTVAKRSKYEELAEYTTVTGRLRRVGEWDSELARLAAAANGVNKPVLTFLNYISKKVEGVTDYRDLNAKSVAFLESSSLDIGLPWYAASTSKEGHFIEMRLSDKKV